MGRRTRAIGASPWPSRLALTAALFAVPLFVFGGAVTTLGAGMAVDGWLDAEGHFLPLFPLEKWFRDGATFVEHTHRMFGMLVGLCTVALLVVTIKARFSSAGARRSARRIAALALAAVCAQGAVGGFRVLELSNSCAPNWRSLLQAGSMLPGCRF